MMKAAHPPPVTNGNHGKGGDESSLTAAADLIRTLDSAFAEMSSLSASAARDAEDARRNAREASEVARRYTARSYAGMDFGSSHAEPSLLQGSSPGDDETNDTQQYESLNGPESAGQNDTEDANNGTGGDEHADGAKNSPLGTRKRKIQTTHKVQSSSERLARSHAEDVLSLSLELERAKQALENERMAHDETRSVLTEARAKNTQLESQIQKVLNDMETQREDSGRQQDALQQELNRARIRVEAAEEDAQLALDLAKGNAESREQLETWLERALQEIEVLRGQLSGAGMYQHTLPPATPEESEYVEPKRTVRFADSPTVVQVPPPPPPDEDIMSSPKSRASRSMVAAGRHLLHRAIVEATPEKVHAVSLTPEKSAERREKLRQRLQSLDDDVDIATPARGGAVGSISGATTTPETYHNVTRVLRESGQRIGMGGQWWSSARSDDDYFESMARHFCSIVETKLDKQNEEIRELQGLCRFLEDKLALSDDSPGVPRKLAD